MPEEKEGLDRVLVPNELKDANIGQAVKDLFVNHGIKGIKVDRTLFFETLTKLGISSHAFGAEASNLKNDELKKDYVGNVYPADRNYVYKSYFVVPKKS